MNFDFDFYDLEIIPGLYANGTAEISVHADGVNDEPEWFIGRIFLHGEKNKPEEVMRDPGRPLITLDGKIYVRICDELENGSYSDKINERIVSLALNDSRAPQRRMIEAVM